jgi:hypothetical protein
MSVDGVALILRYAECETHWLPADEERWHAYHVFSCSRRGNRASPLPARVVRA